MEIADVTVPDYNLVVGDTFEITVSLKSSVGTEDAPSEAALTLYDNGDEARSVTVQLTGNAQEAVIEYEFATPGMHTLTFGVSQCGGYPS